MPADLQGVTEEEHQSSSSSPVLQDDDQAALSDGSSDGSSESSLAIRVAKLLQSESPATMMSSTPSVTDQEEGKARGKTLTVRLNCHSSHSSFMLGMLLCCRVDQAEDIRTEV